MKTAKWILVCRGCGAEVELSLRRPRRYCDDCLRRGQEVSHRRRTR
jgi:rRNA maturation endonuclease Nob1